MQIRISAGDCRTAVAAAIEATTAKVAADRIAIGQQSLENLKAGAVHNGLHITPDRLKEMQDMVDRDVEHMMKSHPGTEVLGVLNNFSDMLDFHTGDNIVIDDQDFHLLKPHLPGAAKQVEEGMAGVPGVGKTETVDADAPAFA